jgi:hypothetical protein
MKRILSCVVAMGLSAISVAAFAQDRPSDSCAEQRKHDPKKVCTLTIEGSDVAGDRVSPDGDRILAHPPASFGSLIRVRTSMLDKMVRATDRF